MRNSRRDDKTTRLAIRHRDISHLSVFPKPNQCWPDHDRNLIAVAVIMVATDSARFSQDRMNVLLD